MTGSEADDEDDAHVDEDADEDHHHDGGCEGDEAAIPTGGVKPTFTERPVSFIHPPTTICFEMLSSNESILI